MARLLRRSILGALSLAAAGAAAWALWPPAVPVDVAFVARGPMQVTVNEDGRTRIKERFVVSAPLGGRLGRISLREGEDVAAGITVLAAIVPAAPALLDQRARAEAEARVRAAEAALDRAFAALGSASAALELAQVEHAKLLSAAERGGATPQELEQASATEMIRSEERRAAGFARDMARFELDLARAALLHAAGEADESAQGSRFEIRAPVTGRVLRVLQESESVVTAGTPLLEIGDATDLELAVDVLSEDAVSIRPGAPVTIDRWGGDRALAGRVRLVEPAAFTKISALGVEEQRVNVIIDLVDPPAARAGLGDGFRCEASIVVWEETAVLTVPVGSLFRHGDSWAVFRVHGGRAALREVSVGRRNGVQGQILSGLGERDAVVIYPTDRVRDGVRVRAR